MARPDSVLILVPTALEAEHLRRLGGFPGARVERCGFGPLAAAARAAALLAQRPARRVLLIGIAGTYRPRTRPVGSAVRPSAVRLEGVGVVRGSTLIPPSALGFPQWEERGLAIRERLALAGGRGELLTVCAASGSPAEARRRARRHPRAELEDMEAFGVALAARLARVPLEIVRGVSNVAGERDLRRWDVRAALLAAHALALELLEHDAKGARR